jgi:hypothetical protein
VNAPTPESLPVIAYVAGYGRSGSTWLTRLLGQSPGVAAAGEIAQSDDWIASRRPCTCGLPIAECPFWSAVRQGLPRDAGGSRFWRTMLESPLVLLFGFWWIPGGQRQRYRDHERALMTGIAAASSARVVVDSSKTSRLVAGRAAALQSVAGLDVRILHLVRNPQSVRASLEHGTNKELEGRAAPRRWFRRTRALLGWTTANAFAGCLARKHPDRAFRLDFETLCADPLPALGEVADTLGLSLAPVDAVLQGRQVARAEHVAEGNRMRLEPLASLQATPTQSSFSDKLLGVLFCGLTCWRLGISPLGPEAPRRA